MMGPEPDGAERAGLLRSVPLLASLTREQIDRIGGSGEERTFRRGTSIVRQGEKSPGLYLLLNGAAEVRREGRSVAKLSRGDFFGESALLLEVPRTADVVATTDVRCLVLSRWRFWGALGIDPETNRALFEETVRRLRGYRTELVE
jgi:CRP-like cAMP-binding protein